MKAATWLQKDVTEYEAYIFLNVRHTCLLTEVTGYEAYHFLNVRHTCLKTEVTEYEAYRPLEYDACTLVESNPLFGGNCFSHLQGMEVADL